MKLRHWSFLALFSTLFAISVVGGCSGGQYESSGTPAAPTAAGEMAADAGLGGDQLKNPMPRKIIYTGSVDLITDDLDKATKKLEDEIKASGAYISGANVSGTKGTGRRASYTIRVASTKFDSFLKALSGVGEIQTSSRNAQDVSEEFYDAEARLKNKKLEEARLLDLLQKATGKLAEVLTVEKELSRVREEIEQIEGRLRFLSNQTDLSTITITINEVKEFVPKGSPTLGTEVNRAWDGSLTALRQVATAGLLMIVALIPWLVIAAAIVVPIILIIRRGTKKKPPVNSGSDQEPKP